MHQLKQKHVVMLMTTTLGDKDMLRLWKVLGNMPTGLLATGDCIPLILDTGCTTSGMGYSDDFVPGSLNTLSTPVVMSGIAGGMQVTQSGIVHYEILNHAGDVSVLETEAYFMRGLNCHLISPQGYMHSNADPNIKFQAD